MTHSEYLQKFVKMQEHKLKARVNAFQAGRLRSQLEHDDHISSRGAQTSAAVHYVDRTSRHRGSSHYMDFIPTAPER